MNKSIKKFENKVIKNTSIIKGGKGRDEEIEDLLNSLGGSQGLKKFAGVA